MTLDSTTFSFPLRSVCATAEGASASYGFLLSRFHGDQPNHLVRCWCDPKFMTPENSNWPLVLYGPSGVGKTALVETLAARLVSKPQDCLKISVTQLRQLFHNALATRSVPRYQERIRQCKCLILEHLNLLPDDQPFTRDVVQLLDFFQENQRPLMITTGIAPWLMGHDLISSRLCSGLFIEINRPGPQARRQIVDDVLRQLDLHVAKQDIDWLVSELPSTVPQIKSRLAQLALATHQTRLTRQSMENHLDQLSSTVDQQSAVQQILKLTCRKLGQRMSDVRSPSRRKEVVRARSVTVYLCRELLKLPFPAIGKQLGSRDPSTIRHAYQQVGKQLSDDPALQETVQQIQDILNSQLTVLN